MTAVATIRCLFCAAKRDVPLPEHNLPRCLACRGPMALVKVLAA